MDGTAQPQQQDDSLATPAPKVFRETAEIDWQRPRAEVRNFILGHSPIPGALTMFNGETMKVFRADLSDEPCPVHSFKIAGNSIIAGCADASLSLTEVQLPNKRSMQASEVIPGYRGPLQGTFT